MEVVPQGKRLPPVPFQRRDVEEWSRLDSLTGMLEHARVQTDHWAATTCNSSHHFGKVIDSRARNLADGSKEQRQQTKQLEVFQANIPGGSVQVIRSQSLTTSSWQGQSTTTKLGTGSSWSSTRANSKLESSTKDETEFDNLKLALNPLDLSSQKTKASVGRSGSISSRRPPSRPRSIAGSRSDKPGQIIELEEEITNDGKSNAFSQMSRICQQFHEEAKTNSNFQSSLKSSSSSSNILKQSSYNLTNGVDPFNNKEKEKRRDSPLPISSSGPVNLSFLLDKKQGKLNSDTVSTIRKSKLVHQKSCSSEDLRLSPETGLLKTDDEADNEDWRRSSKARRSLQFPLISKSDNDDVNNNSDMQSVNSVLKITKEIEARKQIIANSLNKNNNHWSNIEDVLKKVVNNNNTFEKNQDDIDTNIDDELIIKDNNKLIKKKHSFITVESLKEVRGRLRRLGSPVSDEINLKCDEEDDGIVTESKDDSPTIELEDTPKSVKSYVYGMEALLRNRNNRPTTITGTGSLESRSTNKSTSSSSSNRSEEWYNRRKSYGFEQVNGQSNGPNLYGDKNKVDSSTDSGICRSSETVATIPFWNKPLSSNIDNAKTSHNITIKRSQNDNNNIIDKEINDYTQTGRKTIVTLGTITKSTSNWNNSTNQSNDNDDQSNINNKIVQPDDSKEIVTRGKIADALRSLREKSLFVGGFESRRLSEPITISIPVTSIDNSSEISGNDGLLLKQTKEPINTDKFNIKKPLLHEDTNQFSTSYSKLLFGNNINNNNNTNQVTNEVVKTSENIKSNNNINLQISSWNRNSSVKDNEFKRHSIAVDEAKYLDNNSKETFDIPTVKDRIASFRNQFENKSGLNENSLVNKNMNDNDADGSSGNEKKPKKVEFCKTEVHFAAESGRFNIVETDGKPPSNNIYRRRRRTIAEPPTRTNNLPEIRFGDSQYEKNLLTCNEVNELDPESSKQIPYRLSPQYIDNENEEDCILTKENIVMRNETENNEDDKISDTDLQGTDDKPRSILKYNNNITQKQQNNIYVENTKTEFEENENVNKPMPWKSTVTLQNCENNESELQKLIKNIKQNTLVTNYNPSGTESSAIAADNGLAVRISSAADLPDQRRASWSVAERIRHVEDLKTRGFSTKVNFGSGETTVVTPELRNSPVHDLLSTTWISDSITTNEQISPSKKVHVVTSSNIVPTYIGPMNNVKSVETLVSTRSGHPKITSISLRYTDDNNVTKNGDTENSRNVISGETDKSSLFQTRTEISRNTKLFSTETGKITNYPSSDSFTSSSRGLTSMSSVRKDMSDPENKYKINQRQIHSPKNEIIIPFDEININDEGDKRKSSQILITNRRLHSPCASDSAFLERSSSKHQSYNQITARHKSMSPVPFPTRPVSNLPDYANTRQINHTISKQQIPPNESTLWSNASSSTTSSSVLVNKTKKKEIIKTDDLVKKKQLDDTTQKDKLQKKERRLSTSSSGRDGWLNTPRENNTTRQKTNSTQTKKTSNIEIKKDKKIISTNNNKYEIPNKISTGRHGRESPIYQNREIYAATVDKEKDPFESLETESAILEELTKAADQILLAVNGYTDEESIRVSSDDEYRRKHGKDKPVLKPLTTISELPSKKKSVTSSFGSKRDNLSKTSGSMTQSSVGASSRTRLCKTSSNSSVEGTPEVKSLLTEERSKRRAARLLQRASSRELLLQNTGASSSEDIASGSENTPQRSKQRVVRRSAKQYSSRTTSHQSSTVASTSRTKDRVHRTGTSTVDEKEPVSHSRRRPEEKTKMNRISAISSSGKTSGATTAASRSERTSRTERRPPERPGVGSGGVGRTRTQHALSKKKTTTSASHKEETMSQNTK